MRIKPMLLAGLLLALLAAPALRAQTVGQPLENEKGLYMPLDDGRRVNLRVVDNRLRLYVLDGDGKLLPAAFAKVIVDMKGRKADEHMVLRPDGANPWVTHPRFIKPPYIYEVRVLLYPDPESDAGRIIIHPQELRQMP